MAGIHIVHPLLQATQAQALKLLCKRKDLDLQVVAVVDVIPV